MKFDKVLIIGVGLIGSSIARVLRAKNIVSEIYGLDKSQGVLSKCKDLNILTDSQSNLEDFSIQFDLIIICTPLSTYREIFLMINKYVNRETLVTDVGSTKVSVINDFNKTCTNKKIC